MHRPQMTFHPSPVAPVAPQLQPRISTSLTDVTRETDCLLEGDGFELSVED